MLSNEFINLLCHYVVYKGVDGVSANELATLVQKGLDLENVDVSHLALGRGPLTDMTKLVNYYYELNHKDLYLIEENLHTHIITHLVTKALNNDSEFMGFYDDGKNHVSNYPESKL